MSRAEPGGSRGTQRKLMTTQLPFVSTFPHGAGIKLSARTPDPSVETELGRLRALGGVMCQRDGSLNINEALTEVLAAVSQADRRRK